MSGAMSEFLRHAFRSYRRSSIPLAHSLIRSSLNHLLASDQEVRLRCGVRLRLDMTKGNQNGIFWDDGDAEVPLYWAIRELLPLGGLFLDCGANCGLMGLLARQYRAARVIFVEPHPRLARSIEANILLNNFGSSCELVEAAASDREGEVTFYEDPVADGSHSVHADWGGGAKSLMGKVRCITLESLLESRQIQNIDFVKVDAEGNDFFVLKGLGTFLQPAFTKIIYVEMSRDRREICELMQSRGYQGFVANPLKRREVARRQQIYERGGRACFFQPLSPNSTSHGVVLWCEKDSCTSAFLQQLNDPSSCQNAQ